MPNGQGGLTTLAHSDHPSFNNSIFTSAIRHLHSKGAYDPEMLSDPPFMSLINETDRILAHGMSAGLADNQPSPEMLSKLKSDVFLFSGFKTHAQLSDASALLLDNENHIKPFNQFRQEVQAINQAYNASYLEAEYIFATSSAEMAARWSDLEKGSDRYNLQYRTAKDDRVRDSHAALADTTLPVDDPFWSEYYPPNGWRCRCTAVQVRAGKYPTDNSSDAIKKGNAATTQLDKKGNNPLAIFRFNPGQQKVIFPPHHPYRQVQDKVKEIITSLGKSTEFTEIKSYKNGGSISVHRIVNRESHDYNDIVTSANHFAESGKKVEITPKLHYKDPSYNRIYKELEGTKYFGKCPDFKIGGHFYEVEGFTSSEKKNALRNMLKRAVKQSDRIIIKHEGSTMNHIKKAIQFRRKQGQTITEVWVLMENGKLIEVL